MLSLQYVDNTSVHNVFECKLHFQHDMTSLTNVVLLIPYMLIYQKYRWQSKEGGLRLCSITFEVRLVSAISNRPG